ncbi:MAG: AraC family transcriptional regulator [Clostridia bacterium]|nr:AraC family transcriptional regulator [Clostridia bacterium]
MYLNCNFKFHRTVRAGRHYYDNRRGAPMHYLSYLISGEGRIVSENGTVRLGAGDVFYIPKGYRYQSFWQGEKVDFLSLGFFETGTREEFRSRLQVIPADASLREAMLSIPMERGCTVTCRSLSLFYGVLDRVMPHLTQGDEREDKIVKQAKIYIAEHPRCTVPEIAAACGISEPYLYVVFRRAAGGTPNEIKQRVLCEMAVDLLSATELRVEDISERLGFSSSAYFRKIFKKQLGTTPLSVRKFGSL